MTGFDKRFFLIFLGIFVLAPLVSAGSVDVNVLRFVTNSPGGTGASATFDFNSGFLSYFRDGNIQVDFNVSMSHPQGSHNILLDFNLTNRNLVSGGDINYVIWKDLNLASTTLLGQGGNLCDSNNFTVSVACRLDLNISKLVIDRDGNFFVLIKVYDVNSAAQKPTAPNSDTNLSKTFGIDNTAPSLTWDGNHGTWQAVDANVHVTCTDYNSTGGDANNSGCGSTTRRVDSDRTSTISMPVFSVYDTNVLIGPAGDGNYAFDWNVTDRAGNRALSSSGLSETTDFNRTYAQIDKTIPTVTISNSGGNGGSSTVVSTSFVLTYTSGDGNGSGVDKYWVSTDNITWTDNGTNTSYTLDRGGAATIPATVILYLIGNDGVDKNSTTASYTINFVSGSGGGPPGGEVCGNGICGSNESTSNCPTDCIAVCGDEICTGNESAATCPQDCVEGCGNTLCELTESCSVCQIDCGVCNFTEQETVSETEFSNQPTNSSIQELLSESGFSQNEINAALEIAGKIQVRRRIQVEKKSTDEGWDAFEAQISLTFSNNGDTELRNVKIVERVPKELAIRSAQVISDSPFIVLEDDPIIQFGIASLKPNSSSTFVYSIGKPSRIEEETFDSFSPPVVLSLQEVENTGPAVDCSLDNECNDNNTCTRDRCVNNKCVFSAGEDGLVCGFGKECRNGFCTEVPSSSAATQPPADYGLIALAAVIVLAIGIYVFSKTRKK